MVLAMKFVRYTVKSDVILDLVEVSPVKGTEGGFCYEIVTNHLSSKQKIF